MESFDDFFLEEVADVALLDDGLNHRAQMAGKAADQLDGAVFDLGLAAAQTLNVEKGEKGKREVRGRSGEWASRRGFGLRIRLEGNRGREKRRFVGGKSYWIP